MIETISAGHEFMVQHIGIFVHSHFIGNFATFVQLIVFGNFMFVIHENVEAEFLFGIIFVVFAMGELWIIFSIINKYVIFKRAKFPIIITNEEPNFRNISIIIIDKCVRLKMCVTHTKTICLYKFVMLFFLIII